MKEFIRLTLIGSFVTSSIVGFLLVFMIPGHMAVGLFMLGLPLGYMFGVLTEDK